MMVALGDRPSKFDGPPCDAPCVWHENHTGKHRDRKGKEWDAESMPSGVWVRCTPEWVAEWNVCGSTVRRVILEQVRPSRDLFAPVGHEHLMIKFEGKIEPLRHERGEPA